MAFVLRRAKVLALSVQLISKIYNLAYVGLIHERHRRTDAHMHGRHAIAKPRFAVTCVAR